MLEEAARTDQREDEEHGDRRGDELPGQINTKQKLKDKIQEALTQLKNDTDKVNLTDKEAKFINNKGKLDLNYSCQTAISEDGIIVSAYSSNCPSDRRATMDIINQSESNAKQSYDTILADSGYASYDNFEKLTACNKAIYMPDQQMNSEAVKEHNPYHRNHFIYNESRDCFICPENKALIFENNNISKITKQRSKIYKCKECNNCEKQKLCTKGTFRQLYIENREQLRQQIRAKLKSTEGKLTYLKRMRIESVFGNIKHNLNYVHLYLKGIEKTTAEWQLICIGHNLKKIHKLKKSKEASQFF